ncbi:MAG: PEGA domain-containing protein [Myxococcota bacterium]
MTRKRRSLIRPRTAAPKVPLEDSDAPTEVEDPPAEPETPALEALSEKPVPVPEDEEATLKVQVDEALEPPSLDAPVDPTDAPPPPVIPESAEAPPPPTPARNAFPSMPPVVLSPIPEPSEVISAPEDGLAAVAIPLADAPYKDEVGEGDDYADMERDAPPTEDHPLSIARAVHGAHYDAAYTVPQVPETLRRFDAVSGSGSFAGSVEPAIRMPDPPPLSAPGPDRSEPSLPDVRFDPSVAPPPAGGVPWIALGLIVLFGIGVAAVALTVVEPEPRGVPDLGLGAAPTEAPADAAPPTPIEESPVEASPEPASRPAVDPEPPVPEAPAPLPTPEAAPEEAAVVAAPVEGEAEADPAPEPGSLRIRSNKKAWVSIDGKPVGLTPKTVEVPPGPHTITVVQPGQPDTRQTRTVEARSGKTDSVRFAF